MKTDGRWLLSGALNREWPEVLSKGNAFGIISLQGCKGSALYCGRVLYGTCQGFCCEAGINRSGNAG